MSDLPPAIGWFDGKAHVFPVRAYFEDTDLSGIVYHANYLRWMERARSDMLLAAGVDQRGSFEGDGGVYAVAELTVRFAAPARLDDDCQVHSRVLAVRGASTRIQQRVMLGDRLLTDATVTAAWTRGGRAARQPRDWVDAFKALMETGE